MHVRRRIVLGWWRGLRARGSRGTGKGGGERQE